MLRRVRLWHLVLIVLLIFASTASPAFSKSSYYYKKQLKASYPLQTTSNLAASYDVIVAGTDPEGVMAAISAARNGLKVLLTDTRPQKTLGGLMTLGWLNSLDLNKSPRISKTFPSPYLNRGLFHEWYGYIEGTSFDVKRAANAFHKMVLDEPNIHLVLSAKRMEPIVDNQRIIGMQIETEDGKLLTIQAGAVIDATQDADIAVAAGVPYTYGREDIGDPHVNMAVTLVIKISGVTDEVWRKMRSYKGVGSDERSIWGYAEAREYPSSNPERVKMRSLNIGRQDDNTILINSMQIFGVNPLDPDSVKEGLEIGRKEAPLIVDFLKKRFTPFRNVNFAGTAPELYVRESRHIVGEYRLRIVDLLENRDHPDAIAYGSYDVDIQSIGPNNPGTILFSPQQYGVPFRSLVPLGVDGLLVVGRSASFDTLAHGSARVIPLGMATGEAAGAAVKLAVDKNKTFRELSKSSADMRELRKRLTSQGMDLRMVSFPTPKYMSHPHYQGLLAAVSLSLISGGYNNEAWQLDQPSNPKRMHNALIRLHKLYPDHYPVLIRGDYAANAALSAEQAAAMLLKAIGVDEGWEEGAALQTLLDYAWVSKDVIKGIKKKDQITNSEMFMIFRDVLEYYAGITFG